MVKDDVELCIKAFHRLLEILAWLRLQGQSWDDFSGLIADIHPDTRIIDVCVESGHALASTDRHPGNYPGMRIVTTLPFCAGHRTEIKSTLWGIANSQYDPMIQASQQRLQDKVDEFLRAKAARTCRVPSR